MVLVGRWRKPALSAEGTGKRDRHEVRLGAGATNSPAHHSCIEVRNALEESVIFLPLPLNARNRGRRAHTLHLHRPGHPMADLLGESPGRGAIAGAFGGRESPSVHGVASGHVPASAEREAHWRCPLTPADNHFILFKRLRRTNGCVRLSDLTFRPGLGQTSGDYFALDSRRRTLLQSEER
jgi:hypothetical protein